MLDQYLTELILVVILAIVSGGAVFKGYELVIRRRNGHGTVTSNNSSTPACSISDPDRPESKVCPYEVLEKLSTKMDQTITPVNTRLNSIDNRLNSIDNRISNVELRVTGIETRLDSQLIKPSQN